MTPAAESAAGIRKAAVLLISLGDEAGAEIMRRLSEEEVQKVSVEISRIRTIAPGELEDVAREFDQHFSGGELFSRGGAGYAKRLLENALGPEAARKMLDRVSKLVATQGGSLGALQRADPQQLASFIQNEHPQTIALILANLNPDQGGALLMSLPREVRAEIAARVANLDRTSPEILERIAKVVGQKLRSGGEVGRSGGTRTVADMLNRIEGGTAEEILAAIGETDTVLADTIRRLMFVFEDILNIDKEGMKALVSKIDRKVLTMALKGTSDSLKKHFMQVMSQRGSEMLREDMEALGAVKIRDVETAQQQIIATVKQLQADRTLSVGGSEADKYVV